MDHHAQVNAKAFLDITPLHLAADSNYVDITLSLMEYGADPTAKDKYGKTPAQIAARRGYKDIVAVLIGKDRQTHKDK